MFAVSALLFSVINGNILERIQNLKAPWAKTDATLEAAKLNIAWSDCSSSSAHGKTTSLTPAYMTLGQTTEMVGVGSVDETVTGGTFEMTISSGLLNKRFSGNICDPKTFKITELGINVGTLSWEGMACPVSAGPATVKMSSELSSSIPASMAAATIRVTSKDQNGGELICLQVKTS